MEGGLRPSFLLLLLLLQPGEYSRADADELELTGTLGGSVTFPLGIPASQKFTNGAWSVNTTKSLATVAAGNPPRILLFHSAYEGRLRIPDQSYSLQLTSLRLEDTGTYSVEFNTDKEKFGHREFVLQVHKEELLPTIACDSVTCDQDSCSYTLRCVCGSGGERVTYRWRLTPDGRVLSSDSILRIPQRHHTAHENVTCMVQLPNGKSSRTVSPKDFCTELMPATMIACDSVTCGNGACNYTLRCIAGKRGGDVAYRWTQEARGAILSMDPILRVSLRPFEVLPAVTCTAQYSTSNSSMTVSPKDVCPASPSEPSQASPLSYGHVVLLLALGALGAMA